jgi:putative hydrolases of HD superfamily
MKSVLRQTIITDGSRRENDAEHSWHLAVMVMILAEYYADLDVLKTLKMVLIHDLVEIDAGDTYAYDEAANLDKATREQAAAARIFALLPSDQGQEFASLWQEFEELATREALYAAMVDRLQPLLLNFQNEGRVWRQHGVTAAQVTARNQVSLDTAPAEIAQYIWEKIREAGVKNYLDPGAANS